MTATRLIVFARRPVLGRVKSRLAATLGAASALEAYRRLLGATIALAEASGADRLEMRLADDGPAPDTPDTPDTSARPAVADLPAVLVTRGWTVSPQSGSDLGERMREALSQALSAGERPVLIGSDCPSLTPADIVAAFAALDRADAVFVPTEDGGYALVGLSAPAWTLFESISWSTARVADQTRQRAAEAGLRVEWLRTVWDVDVEADLRRWEAQDR
jgi:rSAM/selenodomain-associated transferase 1